MYEMMRNKNYSTDMTMRKNYSTDTTVRKNYYHNISSSDTNNKLIPSGNGKTFYLLIACNIIFRLSSSSVNKFLL